MSDLPEECCVKCRYSRLWTHAVSGTRHEAPRIECRINPPIAHASGSRIFPIVLCGDWCGKFQPLKDAKPPENPILDMHISGMTVSVRCRNSLEHGRPYCTDGKKHVDFVRDLVALTPSQVLEFRNLGEKSLTEIREWLDSHGLRLAHDTWRKGDS